ncbi:MAG: M1 family metallopeptidase [Flavobacteriaceae bacterium]|nr:M1 family metallopeptidase [Flavobacteriaceae bacterium]
MKSNPFLFLALLSVMFTLSGQQTEVDFIKADLNIIPDSMGSIAASASYELVAIEKSSSFYLDAQRMEFSSVRLNGKKAKYTYNGKRLNVQKKLKPGKKYRLSLAYTAVPNQTVYFFGWDDGIPNNNQIWTQGQGKYTSHWTPSLDDMNDKMVFDLTLTFDKSYQVIANGKLENSKIKGEVKEWKYSMDGPMSSYLLAFVIGNYESRMQYSARGIPIENFFYTGAEKRFESTYRYTKEMFDFLEAEIGMPFPWQGYKQVPVRDFLYAGMENTGLTIFSDAYHVDSLAFADKNYVEVNAHEMAHQWFGNLVTEVDSNHHWLHEGFATYYALLAEASVLGEELMYWKLFDKAQALQKAAEAGQGEALTDPKASSLTFYDKGAWALALLRVQLGEEAYRTGTLDYLKKYQYGNATVANYLSEMSAASGQDLSDFRSDWLDGTNFSMEQARKYLTERSPALRNFFAMQHEIRTSNAPNERILQEYWATNVSPQLRERSIRLYYKSLSTDFIREALQTGDLKMRQAVVQSATRIPKELQSDFEILLNDPSYLTVEQALYLLWVHFPEKRADYLKKTEGILGMPDRNVQSIWLLLASLTSDYASNSDRQAFRQQLANFTSPENSFEIRQRAFVLLSEIQGMTDQNLKDLINATVHPQYAFRSFARQLLDTFLKLPDQKSRISSLLDGLKPSELRYIKQKLTIE